MRIFAIKDETMPDEKVLGYLIYYKITKVFYIELPGNADYWDTPPILSSFVNRGIYTVDSYWSKRWVQQRIIPPERQNIRQILRDNGLKDYDEFSLLLLAMGRCEQDDCYLEEVSYEELPEYLLARWRTKVEDVLPLEVPKILVFFRNGVSKVVDVQEIGGSVCKPYLTSPERFYSVEIQTDGYGVYWSERAVILHRELFSHGVVNPLKRMDIFRYMQRRVVSTAEACRILDCSRQNIDDLIRRDKLHPIRKEARNTLFSKAEVMQRSKE